MRLLYRLLNVAVGFIIIDVVLRWFQGTGEFPLSLTSAISNPIYGPVRELLGSIQPPGVDLAPLAILIGLQLIQVGIKKTMKGGSSPQPE